MTETIAPPPVKPIHHWIGGKPVPGTSGENRASAIAASPGRRTTGAAFVSLGCAGSTFVGSFAPSCASSCTAGTPVTVHAESPWFVRRSR